MSMLQAQPPKFINHTYEFSLLIAAQEEFVWKWLNDPATFTDNQVWPYKVEFYSPDPKNTPSGFHEKVVTNHHGPLISFAGELTSVQENYRDLQYYYGSYALSFRWIRPYRLEFRTEATAYGTLLTCTLSSYVKPFISKFWTSSQKLFWSSFKRWSKKRIKKLQE